MKIKTAALTIVTLIAAVSAHQAMGFPTLPGVGGNSGTSTSATDPAVAQEALVRRYIEASVLINDAQSKLADALGLKEEAAILKAENEKLNSITILSKDELEKMKSASNSVSAKINENLASIGELSDEQKAKFAEGSVSFIGGVIATQRLVPAAKEFADSAQASIKSASLTSVAGLKKKLDTGLYLAPKIPGHVADLAKTMNTLISFCKKAGIKLPDDTLDATKALGDL